MKSTDEQLQSRGYVSDEVEKTFKEVSYNELLCWLSDEQPTRRTVAARRLGKIADTTSIEALCLALEKECALYCKLEICKVLASFGKLAVPYLVQRLGKIGSNRYKTPCDKKFDKKSYPLPRDIAARTLIRIETDALPELCKVLQSDNVAMIGEAIDAIGYICFYNGQEGERIAKLLIGCYKRFESNSLVKWKLIRAMSAFSELLPFLEQQYEQQESKELKQEAERSIIIAKRKKH